MAASLVIDRPTVPVLPESSEPPSKPPRRLSLAAIYFLFLSIYLLTGVGHAMTIDHMVMYQTTQALVERDSFAIPPIYLTSKGPDGQSYGPYDPGQALAGTPLYLLGKAVDHVSPGSVRALFAGPAERGVWWGGLDSWDSMHDTAPPDSLSPTTVGVQVFFVSLLNQIVTAFTCLLVFAFCGRFGFSQRRALAVSLMFGLATLAWVYSRDSFQHPFESLFLLLAAYLLFRPRGQPETADVLGAGIALGCAALVRLQMLVAAPALFVYLVSRYDPLTTGLRRLWLDKRWQQLAAFIIPVFAAVAVDMWVNGVKFGNPLALHNGAVVTASCPGFSAAYLGDGLYGNLLSLGKSVFLYSPAALLGLFGWLRFWRARRLEAGLFAAVAASYMLFYSSYCGWHGEWSWGPRYLLAVVPFLVIPAAYVLGDLRGRRLAAVVAVTAAGIVIQLSGILVNWADVHYDWLKMNLNPWNAYMFVPGISPIPTHLSDLFAGKHVDMWLIGVYHRAGFGAVLLMAAIPLILLATSSLSLSRGLALTTVAPAPPDS